MNKVIDLLRVSTDAQDVARQRKDIAAVHAKFGLETVRVLELVGVSGTATLDNEQVQQILADLASPDVDGIALSALDRLFRPGKRYGQFAILDKFVDEGKRIWSMREGLIDPATDEGYDRAISAGGRAGAEWRELRRRSIDGRNEKLERGLMVCGGSAVKYGYIYVDKRHANGAHWIINEEQADVVRRIFRWAVEGMNSYQIATRLNKLGILSKGSTRSAPGLWSKQTVYQLLVSKVYIGQYKWGAHVIAVPAIIDEATFYAVQEQMNVQRQKHVGRPPLAKNEYLLRSFLWCGKCGRRCVRGASDGHKHGIIYYRCGNVDKRPPQKRHCHVPGVAKHLIESVAWKAVWEVLTSPALLLQLAQAYHDSIVRPDADAAAALKKELERLREQETVIKRMMKQLLIPYAEGEKDLREIRARLATVEDELRVAGRIVNLPSLRQVEALLREIAQGPEPTTFARRRDIFEGLLDLRFTYLAGKLVIEGKVPVGAAAVESTGSGGKNRKSGVGSTSDSISATSDSFAAIPFKLERQVA